MEKEIKQQLQYACSQVFREYLNGKPHSRLAEYGISTSITSRLSRGLKNIELSTIWQVTEALGTEPHDFLKRMKDFLPKDFTTIE